MPTACTRSIATICLLGLAVGGLAQKSARAAVVVINNGSQRTIQFTLEPTWSGEAHYSVAPGRLIPVPVPNAVRIAFPSGEVIVRGWLAPNTLQEFYVQGKEVNLRPVLFSAIPTSALPTAEPPVPVTVPVKLLAEKGLAGTGAVWEDHLREQLEIASQYFQLYCGVRFRVAAVQTWRPEESARDFPRLVAAFSKVALRPGWLAIGLVREMQGDPGYEFHHAPQPLFTHLLLPDVRKNFTREDQLQVLIHALGHFLGAAHSPEPSSIMRAGSFGSRRPEGSLSFDAMNTLVMNLFADELRAHGPEALEKMPRDHREYVAAAYREMANRLPSDREIIHYAELLREPILPDARYLGQWVDGGRLTGDRVADWHETKSSPRLANRELFEPQRPIRWLMDNSLAPAGPLESWVEFAGGDCLPGRVVGFRDGTESAKHRWPPHLLVVPYGPLDLPDASPRAHVRLTVPWLRRIVWQRVAERYQPRTLFLPDGRRLEFRSFRFSATAIQLLRDEGIREVPFSDVAELHLPPLDPWEAYFDQLAALAPGENVRLVRVETVSGLRATSTTERFQAKGSGDRSASWYHLCQPAWSLDPLWLAHETIRVRQYFRPNEVPLSRIDPSDSRQQSDLGGVCAGKPIGTWRAGRWKAAVRRRRGVSGCMPRANWSFHFRSPRRHSRAGWAWTCSLETAAASGRVSCWIPRPARRSSKAS